MTSSGLSRLVPSATLEESVLPCQSQHRGAFEGRPAALAAQDTCLSSESEHSHTNGTSQETYSAKGS